MNMWDALLAFKKAGEERKCIGIRPVWWGQRPCQRYICMTGVDSVNMFGMRYYDFVEKIWVSTWSVLMPTFYEAYAEWEIIPHETVCEERCNGGGGLADDEKFIELLINVRPGEENDEDFLRRYHAYRNGACPACKRWMQDGRWWFNGPPPPEVNPYEIMI